MPLNKPNLFVVGAAKAGTTALQKNLGEHPDIYFSPIKEPHFFSDDIDVTKFRKDFAQDVAFDLDKYLLNQPLPSHHQAFIRNETKYLELFRDADQQPLLAEASASYLWSEHAAENIHRFNSEAKVIILLRNPVDRAFSHYGMDARMNYAEVSFIDALKADNALPDRLWGNASLYVDLGLYASQVERYLKVFAREQILIIWHEELKEQPVETSERLFSFLDIKPHAGTDITQKHNVAKVPKNALVKNILANGLIKKMRQQQWAQSLAPLLSSFFIKKNDLPEITQEERSAAYPFFAKDISRLAQLLNTNLDHWKV